MNRASCSVARQGRVVIITAIGCPEIRKDPMFCDDCGLEMKIRRATLSKPYQYDLAGLKNVYLAGINVFQCPRCRAEAPSIPRLPDLHRALALDLAASNQELDGDQVRFLRKWLGYSSNRFANLLGMTLEHLSRVEHGHKPLGAASDRLLRVIALTAARKTEFPDVAKLFAARDSKRRAARRKPVFQLRGNAWKAAA
jgi:DNA-binding transcriptional regulator YiaG